MKRQLSVVLLSITINAFSGYVHAGSDVYLCTNVNGVKEYKNTGDLKGCKKVDLPPLSIASSPSKSGVGRPAASVPSDFPKVDDNTQKTRDNDRRQILQDELKREQQKLADLQKNYNNGEPERQGDEKNYAKYQERVTSMKEDITRSTKNIDALNRELSNLK